MSELFKSPLTLVGNYIQDSNGVPVARVIFSRGFNPDIVIEEKKYRQAMERAAYIVEAVNSHEMLLAMAKRYYESLPDDGPEQDYYAKYIIGAGGEI